MAIYKCFFNLSLSIFGFGCFAIRNGVVCVETENILFLIIEIIWIGNMSVPGDLFAELELWSLYSSFEKFDGLSRFLTLFECHLIKVGHCIPETLHSLIIVVDWIECFAIDDSVLLF